MYVYVVCLTNQEKQSQKCQEFPAKWHFYLSSHSKNRYKYVVKSNILNEKFLKLDSHLPEKLVFIKLKPCKINKKMLFISP